MLSKFRRCLALVIVSSAVLAAAASSASATTVTVSPGGAATGTATTAIQTVLNTVRRTINCITSKVEAAYQAGVSFVRRLTSWFHRVSSCTLTGGLRPTESCTSTASMDATGLTSGGITPVSVTGNSCTISLSGTCSVTVTGSFSGSYDNSTGVQTVTSPGGQSLVASGSTCTSLPNDTSVTFGASGGGNVGYAFVPSQRIDVTP